MLLGDIGNLFARLSHPLGIVRQVAQNPGSIDSAVDLAGEEGANDKLEFVVNGHVSPVHGFGNSRQ